MHRLTPLLAAAGLAALPLAGCGGNGGESSGPPPQQVVDQGDPGAGKQVFADNCAACHGGDGGGGSGPALAGQRAYTDPQVVVDQIRDGGGGMPAFSERLSARELANVSAFVVKDMAAK